jgi:hypothetical protein
MDLEETEDRNDCAGEAQQQFNRPTKASQWVGGKTNETLKYGHEFAG